MPLSKFDVAAFHVMSAEVLLVPVAVTLDGAVVAAETVRNVWVVEVAFRGVAE